MVLLEQRQGCKWPIALITALALISNAPMALASPPNPLEQSPREPVSKSMAFNRCIDLDKPPSWTNSPHNSCTVKWSVLGSQNKMVLYRARYRWPSDEGDNSPFFVVTEVLFEGSDSGTEVTPIFALQWDETYSYLRPLTFHRVGGRQIIEIIVCLNGTGGCGQDYISWDSGRLHALNNSLREQINSWLPEGYSTWNAPQIDIDSLTGRSGGWLTEDAHCCPSRLVAFTLTLLPNEIKIKDIAFVLK